jgi:REP element-mobilizing transposase RayT
MAHAYNSTLIHCVFSTKERRPFLSAEIRPRVHAFIGGIARQLGCPALTVGGPADHAHILISLPATLALAVAIQKIKANSTRWIHDTFPSRRDFAWQEGYGSFSIGVSQQAATVAYINSQDEHHARVDFVAEWNAILKKHGIPAAVR